MKRRLQNYLNYFIANHKRLNFILKVIKRLSDDTFIDNVLGRNPDLIEIKHYGSKGINKIIYYIEIGTKGDGFFAEYRRLLAYLFYSNGRGFLPLIKSNDNFQYGKLSDYFRFINATDGEIKEYTNVVHAGMAQVNCAEKLKDRSAYALSEMFIEELAYISQKYISLQDWVKQYIDTSKEQIGFSGNILGVHVRGTDYKKNYKGHPVYITAAEYCEKAKELFELGGYEKIFLATDDIDALDLFKKAFGKDLIFYKDVKREVGTVSVAFKKDDLSDEEKVSLGKEVLRDMHTLASCKSLIAGKSQVSICAIISNVAWYEKYQELVILDKGINNSGKRYVY